MKSLNQFFLCTQTYYGVGAHKDLQPLIKQLGYKRVLFLIDEALKELPPVENVLNQFSNTGSLTSTFWTRSSEEPDYDYLDLVVENNKNVNADLIIGIGGGSTLDLAKAVSVLLTNPGKGLDYRGFDQVKIPGISCMLIPTTAGTGSEITINAVFTNKAENKKLGINGKYMNAKYALLDPEFTVNAPFKVALSSGMDALVHTLESFVGPKANLITKTFAREAFRLLFNNLLSLKLDPTNLEKRLNLQIGAYFAAISLFNSNSGIAGAISYPLGVLFHIPHGIGGGMFALPVVKYNVQNGYLGYKDLYDLIPGANLNLSDEQKSHEFVKELEHLVKNLEVPKSLLDFGLKEDDYHVLKKEIEPLQLAFDQNPIKLKVNDIGQILDSFF